MVKRYIPSISAVNWDIKELSKEERNNIKKRLVIGMVTTEEEYQKVIGYMYKKFPYEMDGVKAPGTEKSEVAIQWNYSVSKNKLKILNVITGNKQDMYAFVIYDAERDMEPIMFAGSYFKVGNALEYLEGNEKYLCDVKGQLNEAGKYQRNGNGYVMFLDPSYRRLGLGTDLWWAEAQLYREALRIRLQKEIQNEYSLVSTQKMFSEPSKCIITSPGRIKNDGSRCQIRCLLDYDDEYLIEGFNSIIPNLKTIYNEPNWNFLSREKFTTEQLINPWNK